MKRSKKVALSVAFLTLVTACGSDVKERKYCGDENRRVLDHDKCDGTHSGTFIYVGSYPKYSRGDTIDSAGTKNKVQSNSTAARTSAGLPARGGFGGSALGSTGG